MSEQFSLYFVSQVVIQNERLHKLLLYYLLITLFSGASARWRRPRRLSSRCERRVARCLLVVGRRCAQARPTSYAELLLILLPLLLVLLSPYPPSSTVLPSSTEGSSHSRGVSTTSAITGGNSHGQTFCAPVDKFYEWKLNELVLKIESVFHETV